MARYNCCVSLGTIYSFCSHPKSNFLEKNREIPKLNCFMFRIRFLDDKKGSTKYLEQRAKTYIPTKRRIELP